MELSNIRYEGGKRSELAEYLRDTWDALRQTEQFVMTGNPSLDALLNLKLGEMKRSGIRCTPETHSLFSYCCRSELFQKLKNAFRYDMIKS